MSGQTSASVDITYTNKHFDHVIFSIAVIYI